MLVASSALFIGCGDGNSPSDGTGGTGAGGGSSGTNNLKLTQANNFKVTSSSLAISPLTAPAGQDFSICWGQLTKDIQGHALNPATDINQVTLVPAMGTQTDVEGWLNTGQLSQNKISSSGAFVFKPNGSQTCAMLSQFSTVGDDTVKYKTSDFKPQDGVTYLVVFNTGIQLGIGARTMMFLVPSSSETTTTINATDTTTTLSYIADLHDLIKPMVDQAKPPTVDWSAVMNDGQNIPIDSQAVTRVLVGFYQGKSVSALETGFLNLDQETGAMGGPTQSWQLKVSSVQTANLAAAVGRNHEPALTGFPHTDQDPWLLGMFCDDCQNPAPVIVTILDPQ